MTIADQKKIHERTDPVSTFRAVTERSLVSNNIQQSGFQSMLLKTIENSQSSIAQQNRTRNSEAKYASTAQPKLSAHESEASRASAAKVSARPTFQHTNRTEGTAHQISQVDQVGDQNFNPLGSRYFAQSLEIQDRILNSVASINTIQSNEDSSSLNFLDALDDQKNKYLSSSEPAKSVVTQLQEDQLLKDAITFAKIQHLDSPSIQDDLTSSERSAVILTELSANKIISISSEHSRDETKSAVNVAIQSYVGTEQWGRELRQKIAWMFGIGQQSATLTLNPPNLGPLHVSIKMQKNIAHTTFRTNDPTVRQALTEGLVHLGEMMSQRGLVLGKTIMTEIYQDALNG